MTRSPVYGLSADPWATGLTSMINAVNGPARSSRLKPTRPHCGRPKWPSAALHPARGEGVRGVDAADRREVLHSL